MPPRAEILHVLKTHFQSMRDALELVPALATARVAEELLRVKADGKTAFIIGNGGSAASACHAAVDWQKPELRDSSGGIRAVSLADNVAVLTAWANDTNFDNAFAAQIKSLAQPGDVLIAISGSGNSANILSAVKAARRAGMVTVGLSGFSGGALADLVDISVVIPSERQGMIEDLHMAIVHALTVVLRHAARAVIDDEVDEEQEITQSAAG